MLPRQSHPSISSSADASAKQGAPQDNAAVKRKTENVDPVAHAIIAKNTVQSQAQTCPDETDRLVTDLLEEDFEDVYVEESDDDLGELRVEEMDKDEELQSIMDFVFDPETEDEDES